MEQSRGESMSTTPVTSKMECSLYWGPRIASAVTHNFMVKGNDMFIFILDFKLRFILQGKIELSSAQL